MLPPGLLTAHGNLRFSGALYCLEKLAAARKRNKHRLKLGGYETDPGLCNASCHQQDSLAREAPPRRALDAGARTEPRVVIRVPNVAMPSSTLRRQEHNPLSFNALTGLATCPNTGSKAPNTQKRPRPRPRPAVPKSNPKPRPNSSQQPGKKKRTAPQLKLDGETSGEDKLVPIKLAPPRKRNKRARVNSPPPKPPGLCVAVARQSERDKQTRLRLNAEATESIFNLFGANPKTTSMRAINEKILSLSDHRSSQVGSQGRYTKVRDQPPAPLSPVSKKRGGYHRDTLLVLGHPGPSNTKRDLSNGESGPSKRARFDTSDSLATFNPAFGGDTLSLPSFREPRSVLSTQRATVHTRLQPKPCDPGRFCFGAITPIPEPRDIYSQRRRAPSPAPHILVPGTRSPSPEPRVPPPNPRPPSPKHCAPPPLKRHAPPKRCDPPRQPVVLVTGTPSQSPTPDRCPPKPPPAKQLRSGTCKPPPRKKTGTTTESDTEPEPAPEPKSKGKARQFEVGRVGARSSRAVAGPSTQRQRGSPAPPARHDDMQAILDWLGDVLNSGNDGDESDAPAVDWVIKLLMQRRQHASSSSSCHARTRPPLSRHGQAEPFSSRRPSGSSTKRRANRDSSSGDDRPGRRSVSPLADSESDSSVDLSKNGLGLYPGKRGRVASHAIAHLLAVAIRKGVFQSRDIYFKWAQREYIRAWKHLYPKIKYKKPKRHLLRLNLNADEDYYEHPHMLDVISEAYFVHPDSPVIQHHKDFRLLPLPAVAFILMMMQDCLAEWDTGTHRVQENWFRQQKGVFDAHLEGLKVYKVEAHGRLAKLQSQWFLAGMEFAGIRVVEGSEEEEIEQDFCQPISQARFIRPDSDSEPEFLPEPSREPAPEYNDLGLFTTQSKGKGKAQDSHADDLDDSEGDFEDDD
ncbi:hypothetical protein FRC07_006542 [Ceratobasidium sp. 392]|nr:hypothetical protein FRC07_006542 [Ceratobasidium sp. 392]